MGMRVLAGTLCLIWRQDWAAVKALWGPDLRSRMPFSDRLMPMILVEATRGIVVPSRVGAGGFVSRGMMMFMDLVALNSIWWLRAQILLRADGSTSIQSPFSETLHSCCHLQQAHWSCADHHLQHPQLQPAGQHVGPTCCGETGNY